MRPSTHQVRFYFDPNSILMASGNSHFQFYGYSGASQAVLRVELRFYNGRYQLRSALRNNGTTWRNSSWVTISDDVHFLELDWQAASAAGANNGELTFLIDGVERANLTGINNHTRRIDWVRLGAVGGIDRRTRGAYYFDAFVSRRQSAIGAADGVQVAGISEIDPAEQMPWTEEEATPEEMGVSIEENAEPGIYVPFVSR
jgi:hypothetical protein